MYGDVNLNRGPVIDRPPEVEKTLVFIQDLSRRALAVLLLCFFPFQVLVWGCVCDRVIAMCRSVETCGASRVRSICYALSIMVLTASR